MCLNNFNFSSGDSSIGANQCQISKRLMLLVKKLSVLYILLFILSGCNISVLKKDEVTFTGSVTIDTPAALSTVDESNYTSFVVTGTCSPNGTNNVTFSGNGSGAATNCTAGTWSQNIDFQSAYGGNVTLTVTVSDGSATGSASRTFDKNFMYAFSACVGTETENNYYGLGTSGDPFRICTAAQHQDIGTRSVDWDKYYQLQDNISLAAYTVGTYNIIGNDVTAFSGNYNGNTYTISGLTINHAGDLNPLGGDTVGLFGTTSGATLNDIVLSTADIDHNSGNASSYGGILVGYALSTTITNCESGGTIDSIGAGSGVGGLVGFLSGSSVTSSFSTATVTGNSSYTGGLVGHLNGVSTISSSYATGSVTNTGNTTGGLVGYSGGTSGASITSSYATGNVQASANYVGGLVGGSLTTAITSSYATGTVIGTAATSSYIGGFVGAFGNETMSNNYSEGLVVAKGATSQRVGGFIGECGSSADVTITTTLNNNYSHSPVFIAGGVAGGFIGWSGSCDLNNNFSTGKLRCVTNCGGFAGQTASVAAVTWNDNYTFSDVVMSNQFGAGFVFSLDANTTIDGAFALGNITGLNNMAGFVLVNAGRVTNAYVGDGTQTLTATVGGGLAAGFVGQNTGIISVSYSALSSISAAVPSGFCLTSTGTLTDVYWDVTTSGIGADTGADGFCAGPAGSSTANLQTDGQLTAKGFDTTNDWSMRDNHTTASYPLLRNIYQCHGAGWDTASTPLGSGSSTDPYVICTPAQLDYLAASGQGAGYWDSGVYFVLGTTIDMSGYTGTNLDIIGNSTNNYLGSFNGQRYRGYQIQNLSMTYAQDYVGLFGYTGTGAEVSWVNLDVDTVSGQRYVGGLVGYATGSTIRNNYLTNSNVGVQSSTGLVGGLIGAIMGDSIVTKNYINMDVTTTLGSNFGGGLSGRCGGTSTLSYNFTEGTFTSTGGGSYRGGIVGRMIGSCAISYSSSAMNFSTALAQYVGGLVGDINSATATVTNSLSYGSIASVANFGGLIADNPGGGTVTNSFWDTTTSGKVTSAGGGTGAATAAMQADAQYDGAGWDLDDETANGYLERWISPTTQGGGAYPISFWR